MRRGRGTVAWLVLVWSCAGCSLGASASLGAGYLAKGMCSGIFVERRDPVELRGELVELRGLLRLYQTTVVADRQEVRASLFGLASRKARFVPGLGCAVIPASGVDARPRLPSEPPPVAVPLATGKRPVTGLAAAELDRAIASAFDDSSTSHRQRVLAVIVAWRGEIVAEQYAPGVSAQTPLPGWSLGKAVANALLGVLVQQGRIGVSEASVLPEWSGSNDPRRRITIDDLLRMVSGLDFDENYRSPRASVNAMLFRGAGGLGLVDHRLVADPGREWRYTSECTYALMRMVRNRLGVDAAAAFPRRELFDRLGMENATLEADADAVFVASSFAFATARDWLRLGLLYLNDGVWNGTRVLPEGWVAYSTAPTSASPQGRFGAHFWTNAGAPGNPGARAWPSLPPDAFFAFGFQGQSITIVPSADLVIVRLARAEDYERDYEPFARAILGAIQ